MILSDAGISKNCINIYAYDEICVRCGCCERNPDYRDRIIRTIRYYKGMIDTWNSFDNWIDDSEFRKIQERSIKSNILHCKRKIRLYKKILKTLKKKGVMAYE